MDPRIHSSFKVESIQIRDRKSKHIHQTCLVRKVAMLSSAMNETKIQKGDNDEKHLFFFLVI